MYLPSILLFAAASNLDSFVIGLSYGIKQVKIAFRANLLIGLMILAGTVISMLCGKALLSMLAVQAQRIGGVIILLIGICALGDLFLGSRRQEDRDEVDPPPLTLRRALVLGAGLSANNIGLGVGASMAGLPLPLTAAVSVCMSLFFLWAGNRLGRCRSMTKIGKWAEPVSALLMIFLGILELVI